MSETLDQNIHKLLSVLDYREAMKCFKKKYYEGFFLEYRKSTVDVHEEIMKMFVSDNKEEEMNSAAASLVKYAKEQYDGTFFLKKATTAVDMQCMMVFYVLPSLLKDQPAEDSKTFTDIICEKWKGSFPKETIAAATYDEIYNGFRTTILGFNVEGLFGNKDK
ncbi:MAG: hypothetical protein K5668_05245 [Lachnospiraceae bacterium]|nr:hypothetical protein [Lachnospiraceae bacterium]